MDSLLTELVADQLYAYLLIFVRLGTAFINLPTIGEGFVPTQSRLVIALIITALVTPALGDRLPPQPDSVLALFVLMLGEALVGAFLGSVGRMLMSALEVAGMIIAVQSQLAMAAVFNPALATQASLPGALLGWAGLLLLFVSDLHHLLILSVVDSYEMFPPGAPWPVGDFAETMALLTSRSFLIGVEMAGPFLVIGLLFSFSIGLVNRMAPQIQVFFVFMSSKTGLGLFLFGLTLGAMLRHWLTAVHGFLIQFLGAG